MTVENDAFTFGMFLKHFRTRRHLTQQQLATAIGKHRNAIGKWEQGDSLPANKTTVLDLARYLLLDNWETRQLLEASLTAFAPHWFVPFPRNPFFTGREEVLELLHTHLRNESATLTRSLALCGLGGVGKTQVAQEYAYRYALEYCAVFWIGAETEEQLISGLLRIADTLQLSERTNRDQQHIIEAVYRWLSAHPGWLLIYDNVEDLDLLRGFLPPFRSGALLITTRHQALGTIAQSLDVLPMDTEEGSLLLLRRVQAVALAEKNGRNDQQNSQFLPHFSAIQQLVRVLGGLPLALDQAGAYIEETGCSISHYLRLAEQQSARLLARRGNAGRDHPQSVTATFCLALARIEREQPVSADLLRVCALLSADSIPEEIFLEGATYLGPTLVPLAEDATLFDAAVVVLRSFSLVSRQAETRALSLHRLVQEVLRASLSQQDLDVWKGRVMAAISYLFPPDEEGVSDYFQRCERLLPHAQICLAWGEQGDGSLSDRIALLTHVAAYLLRRSRLDEAESLYQQARSEAEQMLAPEPLLLTRVLEGLADLHLLRARYEEAESLYQRVVQLREQVYGDDHPQVAMSLSGLATLYWRQGKYLEAASLYQRSLAMCQRAFGAEHSQVANAQSQLAMIRRVLGQYEQAETLYRQALHIRERLFDPADPRIALSFYHLAALYLDQGRYEEAKPLFVHASLLWEKVLGPEDLDLAFALTGLAKVLTEQGDVREAEALLLRVLRIREPVLGSAHPQVAVVHHGLAHLARKQHNDARAEHYYRQALAIQEKYLGMHHTDTAETLYDLALLCQGQGRLDEAIALANRVLAIRVQALGDAHPKTVAAQTFATRLRAELNSTREKARSEQQSEVAPSDQCLDASVPLFLPEHDPLRAFLNACCELHPQARCRSSDLWRVYERWTREHQERFPLSRRALSIQLKAHGCHADRTNTTRIWRGIALIDPTCDEQ